MDPVRFRFMDAMERRAAARRGSVRDMLDRRLSQLLKAYADDLERGASTADVYHAATSSERARARGALAELVDYMASRAPGGDGAGLAENAARLSSFPEPEPLQYFRELWSRVSIDTHLRLSLEQVPENAGPLNSNSLIHRSLALMHELSPAYLQQFLSYVDGLSRLEQMCGDGIAPGKASRRHR